MSSSNHSSYFWPSLATLGIHLHSVPTPTVKKPLEEMSDEEAALAVVEALKFPYICKRCAKRVKLVDSGGLCTSCQFPWGSYATMVSGLSGYASSSAVTHYITATNAASNNFYWSYGT